MLEAYKVVETPSEGDLYDVALSFEQRQKSRYRTTVRGGEPLGWFLERGHVLRDGEYLLCRGGSCVRVHAAPERVSDIRSDDQLLLTRAAYHLGNRHVPLQIGEGYLRYQHDHVLDNMIEGLGLKVDVTDAPFHPENGAYHGGSHGHAHHHHGEQKGHA